MSEKNKYNPSENHEAHKPRKTPNYGLRRTVASAAFIGTGIAGFLGVGEVAERINKDEVQIEVVDQDIGEERVFVRVEQGDTPWGIARQHYGDEVDIRPYVKEMVDQLNKDGTPGAQPGDIVEMPPHEDK
jgi:hypothetical protein